MEHTSFTEEPGVNLQQMVGNGRLEPRRQKLGGREVVRVNKRLEAECASKNGHSINLHHKDLTGGRKSPIPEF